MLWGARLSQAPERTAMNIAEHIERLKRDLAGYEKYANEARLNLGAVETIRAKYPDAEWVMIRREKHCGESQYCDYESVGAWQSSKAAEDVHLIDGHQLSVSKEDASSPRFAAHVLYVNVPTANGDVRVYSAERVDIITAVDRFQSGEESTLVNALRGTEYAASVEYLVRCEKVEKAQKARDAEREARRQSEAIAKAQPVVVVGTVATKAAE